LKKRVNLKRKTAKLALASTFFLLMLIFIEKINERNAGRVTDVWIRAAAAYKVREKTGLDLAAVRIETKIPLTKQN